MKHYHYIFAGSGLASLMTVYRMAISGDFKDKSILLLDSDTKKANDRTWCFWEKGEETFESIVHRNWATAVFADKEHRIDLDFEGYRYKMIRGIDFYEFVFEELKKHPNIELRQQKVADFSDLGTHVLVKSETENYTCNKFFNSIYNPALAQGQKGHPLLQQHFIGWHVKTDTPAFDKNKPVFMDFSIPQKGNTRFMYVLPFAEDEAIVEYTLFSKHILDREEYETAIKEYLGTLGITEFGIIDDEKGSIPMTTYPFWKHNTKNILNIGSAGGWTKASTGYTFSNTVKLSALVPDFLKENSDFTQFREQWVRHFSPGRFRFYDALLLDILDRKNEQGSAIFSAMFRKGKAGQVFKFLDEETSLAEDLAVIARCPKRLFMEALLRHATNL